LIRNEEQKKRFYTSSTFYESKLRELSQVEERVCWLLARYTVLRNSDQMLIFNFWRLVDGYNGELDDKSITELTSAEGITRSRRKIQHNFGLFLPKDPEVIKSREISEDLIREWANTGVNIYREDTRVEGDGYYYNKAFREWEKDTPNLR